MPGRVTADERKAYLDAFADRLYRMNEIEPLFFHPWSDYDETQRLKPGVAARSGVQWNPQAGQNFEAAAADFAQRRSGSRSRT
jgi:NAD(P)H dehydrogenase (quinone)